MRVELKVSVNCCDGCRKKLDSSIGFVGDAGVLRTEVHPTAGSVAVVGDVDAGRLVKRLAKVGKIAEVIVPPPPEGRRRDTAAAAAGRGRGREWQEGGVAGKRQDRRRERRQGAETRRRRQVRQEPRRRCY
ncbi:hypothetical protein GUJ93_ZPchr0010g7358 [Zizania palustris]|uniref:HMA domain-containing protein n=1 Tax=Zizania palustris TaxID=103762 RepID=A0A8J6BGV6_ZIZPA|nr:hypothetical protein GUJ93_ZPchr0010g7358 [Zizania palustris]